MKAIALMAFHDTTWNAAPLARTRGARNMGLNKGKGETFIVCTLRDTFLLYPRVHCF